MNGHATQTTVGRITVNLTIILLKIRFYVAVPALIIDSLHITAKVVPRVVHWEEVNYVSTFWQTLV